jgi:hypothetical protein
MNHQMQQCMLLKGNQEFDIVELGDMIFQVDG